MKNKILFIFGLLALVLVVTIVYGKSQLKDINYETYSKNNTYYYMPYDEVKRAYLNLPNYVNKNGEVDNLEELQKNSDYIIVAEVKEHIMKGEAIINNCNVKKVLKGDISLNSNIYVYDLVVHWSNNSIGYIGGSTPLANNETYIMFLNKTGKNNLNKEAYVFSSYIYGHVNTKKSLFLENYEQYTLSSSDISKYDYVFPNINQDNGLEIKKYEELRKNIIEYVGIN